MKVIKYIDVSHNERLRLDDEICHHESKGWLKLSDPVISLTEDQLSGLTAIDFMNSNFKVRRPIYKLKIG